MRRSSRSIERKPRQSPRTIRAHHRLGGEGLEHERSRLGIVEHILQLGSVGAPIERCDHHAGELAGPMEGCRLEPVLQQRHQPRALFRAQLVQQRDEPQDVVEPGAVGQPALALDDGQRIWAPRRACENGATEIEHRAA